MMMMMMFIGTETLVTQLVKVVFVYKTPYHRTQYGRRVCGTS
jgi:hypothetical protein